MFRSSSKGFTVIELLAVFAIIALLSAIGVASFRSMYAASTLRAGASEVFNALTQARVQTISSQDDMVHGVQVSSTTITRFAGATYVENAAGNLVYTFEGDITATSSIIDSGGTILFSRLTGTPSTAGTIYIYDTEGAGTTTVIIQNSGLIEFN